MELISFEEPIFILSSFRASETTIILVEKLANTREDAVMKLLGKIMINYYSYFKTIALQLFYTQKPSWLSGATIPQHFPWLVLDVIVLPFQRIATFTLLLLLQSTLVQAADSLILGHYLIPLRDLWIGIGILCIMALLFVFVHLLCPVVVQGQGPAPRYLDVATIRSFPEVSFRAGEDDDSCFCGESYIDGEILRKLPSCQHRYHNLCIERWLTTEKAYCPYCKHDYTDYVASISSEIDTSNSLGPD